VTDNDTEKKTQSCRDNYVLERRAGLVNSVASSQENNYF